MTIHNINAENGTINAAVAQMLIDVAKGGQKTAKAQEKLNTERTGIYVTCMLAATMVESGDDFAATIGSVMEDIRTGAIKVGAKAAKKPKGDTKYQVPGSLSTAKSVILKAYRFEIAMIDAEGNPRKFGEVRDDGNEAQKAADRLADPNVNSRFELAELLSAINTGAEKMTGEPLAELVQLAQNLRTFQKAQKAPTKAAEVAKALADAATDDKEAKAA